jgi:hypothetical protein
LSTDEHRLVWSLNSRPIDPSWWRRIGGRPMKGGAMKAWQLVLAALIVPMLVLVGVAVLVSAMLLR